MRWKVSGAQHAGSVTGRGLGGAYVISPRPLVQTNELFLRTAAAAVELVILPSPRAALEVVLYAPEPFRVLVAQSHSPQIRGPRQLRHGKQNEKARQRCVPWPAPVRERGG